MKEIVESLNNFVSQMDANKQYFESIDDIISSTFNLSAIEDKESKILFDCFLSFNRFYESIKESPEEMFKLIEQSKNKNENISSLQFFSSLETIEEDFSCFLENLSFDLKRIQFNLDKDKGSVVIKVSDNKIRSKLEFYIEEEYKKIKHKQLLYQTSLITISNSFEAIIFKLISYLTINDEKSKISDKTLTFQQIKDLGGLDEAREYLIEKYVEDIMRGSQINWLKYIGKSTDKKFFNELIQKDEENFIEFFLRRNLIIHNNSIINNKYLSAINVSEDDKKMLCGQEINVTKDYLSYNFDIIFTIVIKASFYVLKKKFRNNMDELFYIFENIAFKNLETEEYNLAYNIYDLLWRESEKFSANCRIILSINYMQSLKWTDKIKEMEKVLLDEDFSLVNDEHNMCLCILKDNYEQAVYYLDRNLKIASTEGEDEIELINRYINWPIFKEFKNSDELNKYLLNKGYKSLEIDTKPLKNLKEFEKEENLCHTKIKHPIKYKSYLNNNCITLKRRFRGKFEYIQRSYSRSRIKKF